MVQSNPAQIYKKTAATTASPGHLVLMLYDGLLRFLHQALDGANNPDFIRGQEVKHNNIVRAQAILTELQATLNFEKGGDLSETLYRLYDYMMQELQKANTGDAQEPLGNVIRFAGEIRDSWAEMLREQMNQPTPS